MHAQYGLFLGAAAEQQSSDLYKSLQFRACAKAEHPLKLRIEYSEFLTEVPQSGTVLQTAS